MPKTWRVLVCDGLAEVGLAELEEETEVVLDDLASLGSIDGWIVRGTTRIDGPALDSAAPRLRVVGRAGVGVDNIDLEAARRASVMVVTAPEATTNAVAEHTLGLILALARGTAAANTAVRRGEWPKSDFLGVELRHHVLGLIGFGRIARAVAALAEAFGMQVLAYDPYFPDETLRSAGIEPAGFESLLETSDFVSLHIPLTPETRHLINHQAISRMKPGARLLCTARGGLIDETALLEALDDGRLAGAALDVFEREPPGASPLVRHPRLLATPHLGAQTQEAQARVATEIVREVLGALRGEPPRWRVA